MANKLPTGPTGYTCQTCGCFVQFGVTHTCHFNPATWRPPEAPASVLEGPVTTAFLRELLASRDAVIAERDRLQRVVDKAYDDVQEFSQDPVIALRCVAETLEVHVSALDEEQSRG